MEPSHANTASIEALPPPVQDAGGPMPSSSVPESAVEQSTEVVVAAAVPVELESVVKNEEKIGVVVAPKAVILPRATTFDSFFSAASSSGAAIVPAPIQGARLDHVSLTRAEKGDGYVAVQGAKFENNIYRAVGFLELANAGDFAANVWNDEPVPVYATVFMAVGATVAGTMSIFAFMDSRLAWRNVCFLRKQQKELQELRAQRIANAQSTRDVDVLLAIVFRELGGEAINRWGLDIFMGFGAVLISIGTYMALGGANHQVWLASNILSGYLGNAPVALFGFGNACWAAYIFCKAQGHVNAAAKGISGTRAAALVKRRSRTVQVYSTINGTATILGGVGSMLTATMWWGYVILIPVIMSSIFCNFWWRLRVGYTRRDLVSPGQREMNVDELTTTLEFAARAEIAVKEHESASIDTLISANASLQSVILFFLEQELFEAFCLRLVTNKDIRASLASDSDNMKNIHIDAAKLLSVPEELHSTMKQIARDVVRELGPSHFRHRERYAAELLGTYLAISQHEATQRKQPSSRGEKARR